MAFCLFKDSIRFIPVQHHSFIRQNHPKPNAFAFLYFYLFCCVGCVEWNEKEILLCPSLFPCSITTYNHINIKRIFPLSHSKAEKPGDGNVRTLQKFKGRNLIWIKGIAGSSAWTFWLQIRDTQGNHFAIANLREVIS